MFSFIKPHKPICVLPTFKLLKPFSLLNIGLFVTSLTLFNTPAQATLPDPIEQALFNSNLESKDISLIITPVKSLSFTTAEGQPKLNPYSSFTSVLEPVSVSESEEKKRKDAEGISSKGSNTVALKNDPTFGSDIKSSDTYRVDTSDIAKIDINRDVIDEPKSLTLPVRHLPDMPRTPASTMKLIPTFVGLDLLGKDFVWLTQVYHTGVIVNNTLYGDLIIKGSGDPKLTHQRLEVLLAKVNKAGIRHIKGDIVLDTSIFRDVIKDPAKFDNDPLRPYNASPYGLLINFNSIEMTTAPVIDTDDNMLARIFYAPKLADYALPTLMPVRDASCTSLSNSLSPVWQSNALLFQKTLPKPCASHTFYIAHPDATTFAKKVVKQKWLKLGNTLSGSVISTEHPAKTRFNTYLDMSDLSKRSARASAATALSGLPSSPFPIVSYQSLPLAKQIHDINHYSNNVMTEQLMLSLPVYQTVGTNQSGIRKVGVSDPSAYPPDITPPYSNYALARSTIDTWWRNTLTTPPPNMTNGSGLCRDCTVSAENLAELLEHAYHHPNFDTYIDSLGVAGISGTIKQHAKRLPDSNAIGQAWIKTGTLDNVTAMAGYVHGDSGQDYVVVGIINAPYPQKLNVNNARYVLDTMLDWTAKH